MLELNKINIENLNEDEAIKLLSSLRTEINKYNNAYYIDNQSLVKDSEYDLIIHVYSTIEKKFPNLKKLDSPTYNINVKLSNKFLKVPHAKAMHH